MSAPECQDLFATWSTQILIKQLHLSTYINRLFQAWAVGLVEMLILTGDERGQDPVGSKIALL